MVILNAIASSHLFPWCHFLPGFIHINIKIHSQMYLVYYQLERYFLWNTHWVWPSTERSLVTTLLSKACVGCSSKSHSNVPRVFSVQPYKIYSCLLTRKVPPLNENNNYIHSSFIISTWIRKERKKKRAFSLKTLLSWGEVSHFGFICKRAHKLSVPQTSPLPIPLFPLPWEKE